jgi:hypothetical protein
VADNPSGHRGRDSGAVADMAVGVVAHTPDGAVANQGGPRPGRHLRSIAERPLTAQALTPGFSCRRPAGESNCSQPQAMHISQGEAAPGGTGWDHKCAEIRNPKYDGTFWHA